MMSDSSCNKTLSAIKSSTKISSRRTPYTNSKIKVAFFHWTRIHFTALKGLRMHSLKYLSFTSDKNGERLMGKRAYYTASSSSLLSKDREPFCWAKPRKSTATSSLPFRCVTTTHGEGRHTQIKTWVGLAAFEEHSSNGTSLQSFSFIRFSSNN